ncbi:DUF4403 family protein [Bradyrhizobium sp.]|uniref:DUF4403 family protein n=1 Tax=Bradyrhizobium sp. TaxID=376 RepID=UPI000AE53E6A|nr:DUF4403 family protein [Bradyrhizobium sp.]
MRLPIDVKTILIGIAVVAVSFFVSLTVMDWVAPRGTVRAPVLVELPPLPPGPRASRIIAPVAIALSAIRDAADRGAPRVFTGKADNPVSQILQNADIGWTASRGSISATGAQDVLSLATPLTGTLNVTGSLSAKTTGAVGDALGGLLGGNVAKQIGSVSIKNLNASAEIKGNVTITARPKLVAGWRIEPNLAAQVSLGDTGLVVAGARVNVPAQVKPLIDQTVAEQIAVARARIRNDPALEQNARIQWSKACRSIPLQGTGATSSVPALWLELRPTRAIAAQPRIDAAAVTLTLGIEAETRITPVQTRPDCPFPATIAIIPATPGRVSIGMPIDMPFTEINKIVEAQFAGRSFPEDGSGPVDVTVKRASVAASGERLLISLLVNAKEKKSLFGFGGEAQVHIWGRPVLDHAKQTLRLTDIELAVESEAAFGLLGAAARAAMPHLQRALSDRAAIDLKPFAGNAQKKIAAVIADFQKSEDGVRVVAEITGLRLAEIAFDSKTLRVIAEADGTLNVYLTALPGL